MVKEHERYELEREAGPNPIIRTLTAGSAHKRRSMAISIFFCLLAGFVFFVNTSLSQTEIPPKEEIISSIDLNYTWCKKWYSRTVTADFTITNKTPYDLRNVEINCNFLSSSGTSFGESTRTIFDIVLANGSKQIEEFKLGTLPYQSDFISCKITDASYLEPTLFPLETLFKKEKVSANKQ